MVNSKHKLESSILYVITKEVHAYYLTSKFKLNWKKCQYLLIRNTKTVYAASFFSEVHFETQ